MRLFGGFPHSRVTEKQLPLDCIPILVPGQAGDPTNGPHNVAEVDDLQFTLFQRTPGV
ncbi:hypothetical protein [Nocardia nova]|uniref:hypothetical protein n=1 Tax=Nocardia nova TaxID=37330 RepID=UPI0033DE771D